MSSSTSFTSGEYPRGRRPGGQDTRAAIVAAARACFTEVGYERASLRAIARRAGVDPALVHHYFDGKPALFVEVLHMAADPRRIAERLHIEPGREKGSKLVAAFLGMWEPGPRFISLVQAVSGSPDAADGLREFLSERVWSFVAGAEPDGDGVPVRRALIASQLFGVGWTRYVLRLEPFASASIEQVAAWVGPTIDRYFDP